MMKRRDENDFITFITIVKVNENGQMNFFLIL